MKYNLKDAEKIQETEFCCPTCLTKELLNALEFTREYECIDLIAKADVITDVMRVLLNSEVDGKEFTLGMVEIDGSETDYIDEYILTINDDFSIWVEPAWRNINGEYKLFDLESYIIYLHGDCDSKILQKLEKEKKRVMIFDFEEDEE